MIPNDAVSFIMYSISLPYNLADMPNARSALATSLVNSLTICAEDIPASCADKNKPLNASPLKLVAFLRTVKSLSAPLSEAEN